MVSGNLITELRKFVAPEFVFGIGARLEAGRYARNLGARHVLVVSDPGVVAAGWTGQVLDCIREAGLEASEYTDITPNPKDFEVMMGSQVYQQAGCDAIVVVGGGSPIDCAKGIAIVSSNGGHILDYEGVDTIERSVPPLICIPTTAGTAADVSQFAIISDVARKTKIAIISKMVVPDISLIDPQTTTTMDPFLTACTGVDTLTHAIEAFVSNANSPITDLHALKAIDLVYNELPATIRDPDNLLVRQNVMLGTLEAGLAFSNASLGAVHAMAHSLGGYLDLPHGECNAILLDHVMEFNFGAVPERFRQIADVIKLDVRGLNTNQMRSSVLQAVRDLRKQVKIKPELSALGVRSADVLDLAKKAVLDPCLLTNPRDANRGDVEVMYEEAL